MLDNWCDGWKMAHFPTGWLPTINLIVPGLAFASLYVSDSDLCWMENVISNPESDDEQREDAILSIANSLAEIARSECGSKWMFGSTHNDKLLEKAKACGFMVAPKDSRQVVRPL